MNRLKSVELHGIRGVKGSLPITLDGKSVLIYGDNGSGKSSISDALEWFYYGGVEHLSGEEIGRGGLEALRNVLLDASKEGVVRITYEDSGLNSDKRIFVKNNVLKSEFSNTSAAFMDYMAVSESERLILRYRDLVSFITARKGDRLERLFSIIGFGQVTQTREALNKVRNELKRELRSKNFDGEIAKQQGHIIEHFGRNATSDTQFVESVNGLVEQLGPSKTPTSMQDIDELLKEIGKPADAKSVELYSFYGRISDFAKDFPQKLQAVSKSYSMYYQQFKAITASVDKMGRLFLDRLLTEGLNVLRSGSVKEDKCPLCQQPKNRTQLTQELEARTGELARVKAEKSRLAEAKESLLSQINEPYQAVRVLVGDKNFESPDNRALMESTLRLKGQLEGFLSELKTDVLDGKVLQDPSNLAADGKTAREIVDACKEKIEKLDKVRSGDKRLDVYKRVLLARNAYLQIRELEKTKKTLESQHAAMETVYGEFLKKQREGVEDFLHVFSKEINSIYEFMNPSESIRNMRVVPMEKDDQFVGITIEYEFFKKKGCSPTST